MKDYEIISNCLLCGGNIEKVLQLGNTPLANEFLKEKKIQDMFPLNLVQCQQCQHVQIDAIVNEDRLYKNYSYVSGTSPVNINHFMDYTKLLIKLFSDRSCDLRQNELIIDIGSNDGTMLKCFQKMGLTNVLGVDPAENIAEQANKNGITTLAKFFNEETAKEIYEKYGKARLIICNNMFAHNKDLSKIVNGVKHLLDDVNGTFVFEVSYIVDVCKKSLIDLVYHEHMHHHNVSSLSKFFQKFDMSIYFVQSISNHGGSIRVFVCKNSALKNNKPNLEILDREFLQQELKLTQYLQELSIKVNQLGVDLNNQLNTVKQNGQSIAIYGTPAKATTLMYALNIDESMIDFAIEDAPLKQGTFTPGKHIPVFSFSTLLEKNPDVVLVLAWNFADSIIDKCKANGYKGKFIIPLPELRVV